MTPFSLARLSSLRKEGKIRCLGLLLHAFKPFALFCFHKIFAHFFGVSSSFGLRPHSTQNPPLGFSSRSDSFAFCALHKPAQYPRSPDFVRPKIRSWIIGVLKVLYSISKFYSKISPFQQPCSHGCSLTSFDSTAAQNPLFPYTKMFKNIFKDFIGDNLTGDFV